MPVNQFYGLQVDLPQLVAQLSFNSVKDYDDYIARLKKVPLAFQQITDDMSIGMEDHREPPAYLMEKVLAQVNTIANQKPQDSPFALPLKKFPASVSATEQARIKEELLAAISRPGKSGLRSLRQVSANSVHSKWPQGSRHMGSA